MYPKIHKHAQELRALDRRLEAVAQPTVVVVTTMAGESFTWHVELGTVAGVKQAIRERDGTPPSRQQLLCGADVLDDAEALLCCGAAGATDQVELMLVRMSEPDSE